MKKILILLITMLLFTNNDIYASLNKQDELINSFKQKVEKMDKYSLEYLDISLKKLKVNYRNSAKTLYVLNKLENLLTEEINKKWIVSYTDYDYVLDFDVDENVLWYSDNVFVAKVVKNNWISNKEDIYSDLFPKTSFEVEIIYNIKWNLNWKINTIFQWWYDSRWILTVWEWSKFLEEWGVYLLATMWDVHNIFSHKNWNHLLLKSNKTKTEIKNIIKENKKIKNFRDAYKNSPPYKTENRYIDLTKEEKEKYEDFDSWFVIE